MRRSSNHRDILLVFCAIAILFASMDTEAIQCLMQNNVSTIKSFVEIMYENLRKEMNDLRSENTELKYSLEFSQKEIADLKTEVRNWKKISEVIENNSEKLTSVEDRTRKMEDEKRSKNIRISGMREVDGETTEQTMDIAKKLIKDKLHENNIILKTAYRVRKNDYNGNERQIIVKLGSTSDKIKCLKQSKKLKGSNIFINEDLSYATMQIRKAKLPELKAKREAGYIAYFSGTDIVLKNRQNGDTSANAHGNNAYGNNAHGNNAHGNNAHGNNVHAEDNSSEPMQQRGRPKTPRIRGGGRGNAPMATRNRP